jgi:hypothetical protein
MTFKRSSKPQPPSSERRSGLNRRWIKAPYNGIERRSGGDRRSKPAPDVLEESEVYRAESSAALEEIVFSNSVRLEAVVRLLLTKKVLDAREVTDMLKAIRDSYMKKQLDA